MIGLGMVNFGNVEFIKEEACERMLEYLTSEHLKEREGAGIGLAMLCFK